MTHQMMLARSYDSGEELWACEQCDRALSVRWRPFRRTVIIEGDRETPHEGRKGDLAMTASVQTD